MAGLFFIYNASIQISYAQQFIMGFFKYIYLIIYVVLPSTAMKSSAKEVSSSSGHVVPTTPLVKFLVQVQQTALHTFGHVGFDPKLYVDMSLKFDLTTTNRAFLNLTRNHHGSVLPDDFNGFVKHYLNPPDDDLVYVEPVDYVAEPPGFLVKVELAEVRTWALQVHSLWKNLTRKVAHRVLLRPESSTLLPLKYPVIVPGSRFREVYYWDSYWVIRGLLASKMYETAKGIISNLISLIDEFGYVLNGARAYYTNRSQPPLLSSMIVDLYKTTLNIDLVKTSLPSLLKEHKFWTSGVHMVKIKDSEGFIHSLSRYYAFWNEPRPESSTFDEETASKVSNSSEKQQLYRDLASAAESGWDFSTRWMRNGSNLSTLTTTSIVPVDLNVFILKMEVDIAFLASVVGEISTANYYTQAAHSRVKAINSVFWNSDKDQWFDYWLSSNTSSTDVFDWEASNQNLNIFASNFAPLWIQLFNSDRKLVDKVARSLVSSGLLQPAGIATSLTNSSQQWDFPNGWAPLQHMIIQGLSNSASEDARALGKDIGMRWIRSNYAAFNQTGFMHEKYDVQKCGACGSGGEYAPQSGFGWSNGVVLTLLEEYGWSRHQKLGCHQN